MQSRNGKQEGISAMNTEEIKFEWRELLVQMECYICQVPQGTDLCYLSNFDSINSEVPELREKDDFHLWRWSLSENSRIADSLSSFLSPDENRQAGEFKFAELKNRYILSHGVLRCILGEYLNLPPGEIDFKFAERGKPRIAESQNDSDIRFSLAHCDNYAACAVTLKHEIGVDIEEDHLISKEELTRLSAHLLQPGELESFNKPGEESGTRRFLRTWTIKEACCKATGEGVQALKKSWIHDYSEKNFFNVGWIETAEKFWRFINFVFEEKVFVSVAVDGFFNTPIMAELSFLNEEVINGTLA